MATHLARSSRSTGSVDPPEDDAEEFLDGRVGVVRGLYGVDVLAQGLERGDDGRRARGSTVGHHLLGMGFLPGVAMGGCGGREED